MTASAFTKPQDEDWDSQQHLWQQFEQTDEPVAAAAGEGREVSHSADYAEETPRIYDDALLDVDYAADLPRALAKGEVDLTARCLYAASRADDLEFVRSLPESTFSEVVRLLQPAHLMADLAHAYVEVSDATRKAFGLPSMASIAGQYSQIVSAIVSMRRSADVPLTLADYIVLLRSARDLGKPEMARAAWRDLHLDGHTPNIQCYNYYMASEVFGDLHNAAARHKTRVVPFFMLARQRPTRGSMFRAFRTGSGGSREVVTEIFRDMLNSGVIANEESFRLLITAAAREGELSTVKSTLRKVWNIDVDGLLAGKDESDILPKELETESPLYPTPKLLFTVAQAFAINHDIPTALRLVDFIARHYNLPINRAIWAQLFEWTFVLAVPRTGIKARTDGTRQGKLPQQSVMELWDTMTSAPYFVEPTMGMYNHLIKNLFYRGMTSVMLDKMAEGLHLYRKSYGEARARFAALKAAANVDEQESANGSDSLEKLALQWKAAEVNRIRNRFWCKRWVRLLLGSLMPQHPSFVAQDLSLREIPSVLWTWRNLLPSKVQYETTGGIIELQMRSQPEIDQVQVKWAVHRTRREETLKRIPLLTSEEWLRNQRPDHGLPARLADNARLVNWVKQQAKNPMTSERTLAEAEEGEEADIDADEDENSMIMPVV
ncbi:hypothetical protein BAUCODRAFT_67671 [Baudoinia panamericana UAMH 10762]|uniref:Uncharacterized protein n=1 Tax=Baudoinia panamericana (strain UAMH 10762) TaxID=717646 RepID=M2NHF7_BAUPA|nr:uncharacterized protein BAUCODRAFT_67671 [Baudoinia panamericana UAMH 10762]EMC98460.1 hypothetical protein BAUCODRAFT_67671 [Baudoinia panamericana UAMH 10762]